MFRFENIEFIYLLVLIPVLLVVFIIGRKIRKRSLKSSIDLTMIPCVNVRDTDLDSRLHMK